MQALFFLLMHAILRLLLSRASVTCACVFQDDLATVMTEYRCRFTDEASNKYQSYIKSATHRSGESRRPARSVPRLVTGLLFI